jgi:fibronectin-binding autotransporter adhesin
MPIQSTDTTTQLVFTADKQTWTVKTDVSVTVDPGVIAVNMADKFGVLVNFGILAGGGDERGVEMASDNNTVLNEAGGYIIGGNSGIQMNGNNSVIRNYGFIQAAGNGFGVIDSGDAAPQVFNAGTISGGIGVNFLAAATALNAFLDNSGTIDAVIAIELGTSTGGTGTVHNSGVIKGSADAIESFNDLVQLALTNTGSILGDIRLDGAADP